MGVGGCAPLGVGITEHPVPASPPMMENKEEYGVPWLWKRVPVGMNGKGCSAWDPDMTSVSTIEVNII